MNTVITFTLRGNALTRSYLSPTSLCASVYLIIFRFVIPFCSTVNPLGCLVLINMMLPLTDTNDYSLFLL
jgi:hypothetical protein